MANYFECQITEDGPRNVIAKVILLADTSDYSGQVVLDPAALNPTFPPTDRLRIDEIQYSVQDGWYVTLFWDAPTPERIVELNGRGMFPVGPNYGGLQNDATGATGIITLSTTGWSTTKIATLIIHAVKQTVGAVSAAHSFLLQESGGAILQESGGHIVL